MRFQQPGESEAACAAALLEELVRYLGRRYFDIVVADALYLQTPFTRRLEQLGPRWVLTLKDNQPDLAATVERLCAGVPHGQQAVGEGQLDHWYWPKLYWRAADTSVCVLKTVRRCRRRRVVITEDDGGRRRQRQTVEEVTTNCWASNLELGLIPPLFLDQPRPVGASWRAAAGRLMPKSFRPSPWTATSSTPRLTSTRPWWSGP